MKLSRISLLGFMATGKSTVGQLLAGELELEFLETDALIVDREGQSIEQIFEKKGEEYFRRCEREVLKEVLSSARGFVLSTGGGIVLKKENRKLLQEYTFPVLLEADPEVIFERSRQDQNRPLLQVENPRQRIRELLAERREFYYRFENRVDTTGKSPREIVEQIKQMMGDDVVESGS